MSNVAAFAALRATLPRTLLSGRKIISKENCKTMRPKNKEKRELEIEKEKSQKVKKMKRERRLFTTVCKRRKEKKPKKKDWNFKSKLIVKWFIQEEFLDYI